MGLLEEVRAAQDSRKRGGCGVGRLLLALDDEDAGELKDALADLSIDAPTLASVLQARGHTNITAQMVQRHRKGACCGQPGR